MTTVQINLPDQLAQEAQRAGLLTSAALERMLREYLKTRRTDELFAAMDRMAAVEVPAMTPEEISEELHAMRAARRQSR
jgi:Arc/MetJ family transcription regulator